MFLDLVHCLWTNVLCLSAGNRKNLIGNVLARAAKTLLSLGAPDSVRCARLARANWPLSGIHRRRMAKIHRTVRCAPDCPVSQQSATQSARDAWPGQRSERHQTVRCAPDSVRCANGSKPPTVGCARTGKKSAPDCPVHQSTEGKICLPGLFSTAPSCLGAIKGTPRRMEENNEATLEHS